MMGPVTLADKIDKIQLEIGLLEPLYEKMKARKAGDDQEWNLRQASLIRQICDLVGKFKIGDEPHKAVAIVAKAESLAAELRHPDNIINEYEEKRQILKMAQQENERIKEAEAKARELYESQPWRRAVNS